MENLSLLKNFPPLKEGLREVLLLLLLLSFQPLQAAQKQMLKSCLSFNPINQGSDNYTTADPDSDADGICDALDFCNGGDDLQDTDGDHLPDACDEYPDCAPFYDLQATHLAGDTRTYHAAHSICSADSLAATAHITYKAGNMIELLPGFVAVQGSYALAAIEPCATSKKQSEKFAMNSSSKNSQWITYPNPANTQVTFTTEQIFDSNIYLNIIDVHGKIVRQAIIPPNTNTYDWQIDTALNGICFYTMNNEQGILISRGKIVIIHP